MKAPKSSELVGKAERQSSIDNPVVAQGLTKTRAAEGLVSRTGRVRCHAQGLDIARQITSDAAPERAGVHEGYTVVIIFIVVK